MQTGAADHSTDHTAQAGVPQRRTDDRTGPTPIGFVMEAGHALRNPLHGVLGLSEMLIEADLEPPLADAAWAIFRQASAMRAVVDDMIDVARIETGHLRVHLTAVHVRYVVDDCVYLARERCPSTVTIEVGELPPHLHTVHADHDRVRQVLGNLLANASAAATSRVEVAVTDGAAGAVRFAVRDDGRGIDPDELPRLCEPSVRDGDGLGLGLTIARGVVTAMGGTMGAAALPTGGSEFWFEVPATDRAVTEPSPSGGIRDDADLPVHRRVLVVEDDPVNRMLAMMQLQRLGATATAVESGEAAWELLQRDDFDVAFVDVQMPGMSGLELVGLMAALERRPVTAIMTASATAADRAAALAAGADHFVPKPATLADLRAVMSAPAVPRAAAGSERRAGAA